MSILINGTRSLPAHRVVLAAASPRMRDMIAAAAVPVGKGGGGGGGANAAAQERPCGGQRPKQVNRGGV